MSEWSWIRRFFLSIKVTSDGCWVWMSCIGRVGYGHFNVRNTTVDAHRWFFQQMFGPVPKGLELDHLCRVRSCVNPLHLEPVTHRENCRRGSKGSSFPLGFCREGHKLTEALRSGKIRTWCPVCLVARRKIYYQKNRTQIIARVLANQARAELFEADDAR